MMSKLEKRYGFAKDLSELSDEDLVDRLNTECGSKASSGARIYFLSCLSQELRSRDFNSDAVFADGNLNVRQKVVLRGDRLDILSS